MKRRQRITACVVAAFLVAVAASCLDEDPGLDEKGVEPALVDVEKAVAPPPCPAGEHVVYREVYGACGACARSGGPGHMRTVYASCSESGGQVLIQSRCEACQLVPDVGEPAPSLEAH